MTVKRTKTVSLEELWAYEARHPVVFASSRALAEARLISDLGRAKGGRRRSRRNGAMHRASHRKAIGLAGKKNNSRQSAAIVGEAKGGK